MNSIEDVLGQVMASHDQEAPTAADLLRALDTRPPPRGRARMRRSPAGWYVPLAAAAAVAAVIAGSVWAGELLGSRRQAGPGPGVPLSCRATYAGQAPWVPARPAGIDGHARLVPQQTPISALICAYAGSNTARRQTGWALSGRRRLTGGLTALAAQLSWQPRGQAGFCAGVGGNQTNYLIGLTYPGGGRIWVAATDDRGDCVPTSNGEFTSFGVVGPTVSRAFASGRWPARQPVSCNGYGLDVGRLGQDAVMVPPGSTSLTICTTAGHTFMSGYQALITALNALPTRPSTHACTGETGLVSSFYQLLFSYPKGPPAEVTILGGCHPAVDNQSLQSQSASTVLPIIKRLLTGSSQGSPAL